MAARFDSFGLADLVAKPEDAFRLADLILAEGQRVPGYRGDYYRYCMGDAIVILRTMPDPETREPMILGMDTHAVSDCIWEHEDFPAWIQPVEGESEVQNQIADDPDTFRGDPMERLVVRGESTRTGEYSAEINDIPVSLLCAEVLPVADCRKRRMNMAAFADWVEYFTSEADYASAQGKHTGPEAAVLAAGDIRGIGAWADHGEGGLPLDKVLLRGVVKDAKVGETYLGLEPLTKFLKITVTTRLGDVELCHPFELVAEDQKDNVKNGAIVSCVCTLSGDAACGEYAGGIVYDEAHDLEVLRDFFWRGDVRRLRPALRSDCAVTFLQNCQEGADSALALLDLVARQLGEAGLDHCMTGTVTAVERGEGEPPFGRTGQRCLLLGDGMPGDQYAFLLLLDLDSLGRVREIVITNDSRYDYEPDQHNTGEDIEHTRDRLRHAFEVLLYWGQREKGLIREPEELRNHPGVPTYLERAEAALAAIPDLEQRQAADAAAYGTGAPLEEALEQELHDIFLDLFWRAGGRQEDGWDLCGWWLNAPNGLWKGYTSYRDQLRDQLALAQCIAGLS